MQQHIEILKSVALISAPLNLFSPERDTGERKTEGLMVDKRSIQFVDTALLAPFRRKRTELRRMLVNWGTRVPLFNAYAIPLTSIGEVSLALEAFTEDWRRLRDDFVSAYPDALERLKEKHPSSAADIARHAPTANELLKRMEFRFTIFQVGGDSIQAESGLEDEMLSLPEKVMEDIAKELNERAGQGQSFRQGIRDVLGRVRAKAEGFSFLHPTIAAIPEAIDKVLSSLPTDGAIQGADGLLLGGLIGALQNRRILEVGIVTMSSIENRLDLEASEAKAEAASRLTSVQIPAIQEEQQRTGTWDF